MVPHVTIGVLLYGQHADLAKRCLRSIVGLVESAPGPVDIRVGLNEISDATRHEAGQALKQLTTVRPDIAVRTYEPHRNVGKYPLMRRMLYDLEKPCGPLFMWFDDDSYVQASAGDPRWWRLFADRLESAVVIGSIYKIQVRERQRQWVQDQPWCTKTTSRIVQFCTGGWWGAQTQFLRRYNYPFPELYHNGGDYLLGELCYQQAAKIAAFRVGVCINADERGRESKAVRRGMTSPHPGDALLTDYRHQYFQCAITERGFRG